MPHKLHSLEVDESDTGLGAESTGLMGGGVLISMDRGLPPTAYFPVYVCGPEALGDLFSAFSRNCETTWDTGISFFVDFIVILITYQKTHLGLKWPSYQCELISLPFDAQKDVKIMKGCGSDSNAGLRAPKCNYKYMESQSSPI